MPHWQTNTGRSKLRDSLLFALNGRVDIRHPINLVDRKIFQEIALQYTEITVVKFLNAGTLRNLYRRVPRAGTCKRGNIVAPNILDELQCVLKSFSDCVSEKQKQNVSDFFRQKHFAPKMFFQNVVVRTRKLFVRKCFRNHLSSFRGLDMYFPNLLKLLKFFKYFGRCNISKPHPLSLIRRPNHRENDKNTGL